MLHYILCLIILFYPEHIGSFSEESVCLGGQLSLNCSTNETVLQWTIAIPQYQVPLLRLISALNPTSIRVDPLHIVDVAEFHFLRTSISPRLVSMIQIENVTVGLNGTRVECSYGGEMNVTTIIKIIENAASFLSPFNISASEKPGRENVTVTIDWTQDYANVRSSTNEVKVTVTGFPHIKANVSLHSAHLVVSYNIHYNVNVTKTLCGQSITKILTLYYVGCNFTLFHTQLADDHLMITSPDYNYLVGMNISLSCYANDSFGLVPTSPILTCTKDGQWSPDLNQIMCMKVYNNCTIPSNGDKNYNSTLENSTLILQFWCKVGFLPADIFTAICTPNGSWIPNPDDHTCTAIEGVIKGTNLIVITSSSLGVALGVIIVLALILTLIIVRRSKGSVHTKKTRALDIETEQMQTRDLEFSKQASVRGQSQSTVLYADLGPLSFKRQPHISTLSINDDKVEYAQLQTYSDMKKVQPTIKVNQNCADSKLNLNILLLQIRADITPKWYEFGEAIGVMKEVLDKWMQYPPDQSIIEVCDHWLRNCGGQPTWRKVAKALKKIGYQQLASDIENVYKTGKLPLESDENKGTPVAAVITQDLPVDETPPPIPPRL